MSNPGGICLSLWGLCRRRVEELWPWWLAHSSPKVRQELVSNLPYWLLRGSSCHRTWRFCSSVADAQHFTFVSVVTRPLSVPQPRGSRQGDTRWAGLHPSILHQALPRWALLTTVGPRGAAAAAWTEMGQVRHS